MGLIYDDKKGILYILLCSLVMCFSCSDDSVISDNEVITSSIRVEVNISMGRVTQTKSDATVSVNRILLLPFVKANEGQDNANANFQPQYDDAKQIDLDFLPTHITGLELQSMHTYVLMVIGYNRDDYDFYNSENTQQKFSLGASVLPATLDNFHIDIVNPEDVPEIFTGKGIGYGTQGESYTYFKPEDVTSINANLNRMISCLQINIDHIPDNVQSISLLADPLVKSGLLIDNHPVSIYPNAPILLAKNARIEGKVSFRKYMLPTLDRYPTILYVDIVTDVGEGRYSIRVPDVGNISLNNRISFMPNHEVKITGSYDKIDSGFIINNSINLDADEWDGLE